MLIFLWYFFRERWFLTKESYACLTKIQKKLAFDKAFIKKKDSRSRIPQFKRNKLNMLWKSIKQFQCEYRETRMESEMNYVDSLFLRCHKIRHCLYSQMNDCRSPIFVSIVYSRENGLKFLSDCIGKLVKKPWNSWQIKPRKRALFICIFVLK